MAIDLGEVTGSTAAREKKKESTQIANGLDKDAFMKLFLEQLKNQDPTSPMETDKIITQTAQLTQVEMQEENKKTMKEVAQAMKASQETNKALQDFQKDMKKSLEMLNMGMEENTHATTQGAKANTLNAVSMIGKIAETDIMGLNVLGSGENHFSLYFDNKIDAAQGSPVIEILSPNNEIVRTISLVNKNGQQGYIDFSWDGKDSKGNIVEPGSYQVKAHYNLNPETKQYDETRIGRGEVQSIIYDKGTPLMRLGDNIVPVQNALEFYPKGDSATHKTIESIKADASKARKAYEDDLSTESLSQKYEKIINDREAKLAAEAEVNKDEETLQAEAEEAKRIAKAKEMKKYEKMLDAADKGRQLDKEELDKLSVKPASKITESMPKINKESTQQIAQKVGGTHSISHANPTHDNNPLASMLQQTAQNNQIQNTPKNNQTHMTNERQIETMNNPFANMSQQHGGTQNDSLVGNNAMGSNMGNTSIPQYANPLDIQVKEPSFVTQG
ncbi:flagellar hook assembly protein FlgD [Helicobacter trogontum]|uniref:Basal-body rod modification protein FlgD n=1 Tax=Helicobacter trogontum TaxID=50960 RepID=A0A4U8SYS5_9HELI|nr:flagellar basal body rod modification protein [Helicobacter trogontum]